MAARHLTTRPAHPWKRTARTAVQTVVALAVAAPMIYQAATEQDPAAATGAAGVGLAIAAGLARVMALAPVETILRRVAPWLSASDVAVQDVIAQVDPDSPAGVIVAGHASAYVTGHPVTVSPVAMP